MEGLAEAQESVSFTMTSAWRRVESPNHEINSRDLGAHGALQCNGRFPAGCVLTWGAEAVSVVFLIRVRPSPRAYPSRM